MGGREEFWTGFAGWTGFPDGGRTYAAIGGGGPFPVLPEACDGYSLKMAR